MIKIVKANRSHVEGIAKVCSDGCRATYAETHTEEYIERVIEEFYNRERIHEEVSRSRQAVGRLFCGSG
jgi:hypothetical protein